MVLLNANILLNITSTEWLSMQRRVSSQARDLHPLPSPLTSEHNWIVEADFNEV